MYTQNISSPSQDVFDASKKPPFDRLRANGKKSMSHQVVVLRSFYLKPLPFILSLSKDNQTARPHHSTTVPPRSSLTRIATWAFPTLIARKSAMGRAR
jgi:hypothetical protein